MAHPAHFREQHPIPFVLTHWINLLAIAFLTFSGFYIHFPFFAGFMGVARGIHFFWMWVLLINIIVRIILAFTVSDSSLLGSRTKNGKDIKNWLPQPQNRHQLGAWLKYYTFLKKEHPISAKYGVLQKIAYLVTIPLTFWAAYTGFCLYNPAHNWAIWGMFQAGLDWVGGPMNMRIIHYYTMWVFIIFTAFHAYLANIEGFAPSRIIFAWKEGPGLTFDENGKVVGEFGEH